MVVRIPNAMARHILGTFLSQILGSACSVLASPCRPQAAAWSVLESSTQPLAVVCVGSPLSEVCSSLGIPPSPCGLPRMAPSDSLFVISRLARFWSSFRLLFRKCQLCSNKITQIIYSLGTDLINAGHTRGNEQTSSVSR
jgi:hypothetical protein